MTKAKGFELEDLEQNDTAVIDLVHPSTGDPIGASVEVFGQDSEKFRTETRKAETKYTEYARRNRGKFMPPEEREKLDKAKIVVCTKSINNLTYKGEAATDPATVYDKFPWIYDQVVQGILDRGNFIKGSSQK